MSSDDKIYEVYADMRDRLHTSFYDVVAEAKVESEIERIMLAAFLSERYAPSHFARYFVRHEATNWTYEQVIEQATPWIKNHYCDLAVFLQVKVQDYRVDFLVVGPTPNNEICAVAVECDGHDFHERTKEQAKRDKSRDRTLLCAGIPVLRFTGSEIYGHAVGKVREVTEYFENALIRNENAA